eukprot:10500631-Lingulodinium_polyedra.AAC.1
MPERCERAVSLGCAPCPASSGACRSSLPLPLPLPRTLRWKGRAGSSTPWTSACAAAAPTA